MKTYHVRPRGVCSQEISFDLDNGKLHNVRIVGGCPGNTSAIGKLLEGYDARQAVSILKGNKCGLRSTSCADQLARGVEQALEEEKQ